MLAENVVLWYHQLIVVLQGAFLVTPNPTRSLGVLETMMRQMIGIKVVDFNCFLFSQQSQAAKG
jgi:hypothetical protein